MQFPLAICVGPMRSGTTWMHELLKNHPQCIVTDPKETSFFCTNFGKGLDWYLSKFQKSNENTKICADLSTLYFIHHLDLARVKDFTDQVKIIICLRNPYQRLRSIHNKMNAIGRQREVLDYLENKTLRNQDVLGCNIIYDKAIYFSEMFGGKNIYYFMFDELETDPEGAAKKLLGFLGLDDFISTSVGQVVNATYEPRSKWLQYCARKVSALLRRLSLVKLVDFIKYSVGKNIVYGSKPSRPNLDEDEMVELLDNFSSEFNTDIEKIEGLIGKDLGHWKRPESSG